MPRNPSGPFLQREMVTNRPTTTGGSAMPVLIRLTTILLPGNRVSATEAPTVIPMMRLINVAVPDTLIDKNVIPSTSVSRLTRSQNAFLLHSRMRSIYFPRSSTFLPASGKKRGDPYLSTP